MKFRDRGVIVCGAKVQVEKVVFFGDNSAGHPSTLCLALADEKSESAPGSSLVGIWSPFSH